MGQKFEIPNPKIAIRALVRDSEGHPKFDDLDKIDEFIHLLSDEDKDYLEKKHGKRIST